MSREAPPPEPQNGAVATVETPPPAPPAAPPSGTPPAVEPSTPSGVTRDQFLSHLRTLSDKDWEDMGEEDFTRIPAIKEQINRVSSRIAERTRTEIAQENAKKQQELAAYQRWDSYFKGLEDQARQGSPESLLAALDDPEVAKNHAAVKAWRLTNQTGTMKPEGQHRAEIANDMVQGLVNYLRDADEWSHLSDETMEEIFAEKDVRRILGRLLETGSERHRREILAKAKEEGEARFNDLLARRGLSASEPEPPAGAVLSSGNGELTLDAYNAMTPSDRRELRRTNPAAVDQMMVNLQEAANGLVGP